MKEAEHLSGWGGVPSSPAKLIRPEKVRDLLPPPEPFIARGLGRSYGDAALNQEGFVLLMERMDRFIAFDAEKGIIQAESGLALDDLLRVIVPRGWFVPVTPGTAFCSLGGCFASDVHGKNHHHEGSFASHVLAISLQLPNGEVQVLTQEDPLFWATAGGMGLTGVILDVTLMLKRIETSFVKVRHHPAQGLQELIHLVDDESRDDAYSVAWIDLLSQGEKMGRGVLMTGHHASTAELPLRKEAALVNPTVKARKFPFVMPSGLLNPTLLRWFNAAYYTRQRNRGEFITDFRTYFYPLDAIREWNKAYGKRGFVQYQFVVPSESGREAIGQIVRQINDAGSASFLAVLKRMGAGSGGPLSFPIPGYTLALDIPFRDGTPELLGELDAIVADAGGRVYLAKDSFLTAERFRQMYPQLATFQTLKSQVDPDGKMTSDLARRLEIVS
ncbi:MAG: FAD-binding oxidoreductase [Fimbriimonadaceae bacterium]|nr:FAD-binding oxidoreductase [Fimbriimonadaceae bacterium]